jgi:hypothetical protein
MQDFIKEEALKAGLIQKELSGNVYTLKLLPAMKGMMLGKRLITAFAPALGVLMDSSTEDSLYVEEKTLCTDVAVAIVSQLDQLDFEQTILDLLAGMTCNGQPIEFNSHFAAKYGLLLTCVEWSIVENFGDFFTEWLKGKGLSIPTLKSMMTDAMGDNSDKSKAE